MSGFAFKVIAACALIDIFCVAMQRIHYSLGNIKESFVLLLASQWLISIPLFYFGVTYFNFGINECLLAYVAERVFFTGTLILMFYQKVKGSSTLLTNSIEHPTLLPNAKLK